MKKKRGFLLCEKLNGGWIFVDISEILLWKNVCINEDEKKIELLVENSGQAFASFQILSNDFNHIKETDRKISI